MRRAPGLLLDSKDLDSFIDLLNACIINETQDQLNQIHLWANIHIGQDQTLARDWVTLVRVFKEVLWENLETFPPQTILAYWHILDRPLSHSLVEFTWLASSDDQSTMLAYMESLSQQMISLERTKSNFIAVAAHELRTPLTIMDGYANMLRSDIPVTEERLHLLLDGFNNGIRRLREIISDMMDISLIDTQSFVINFQIFYLPKMIEMLAANLEGAFKDRRVMLTIKPIAVTRPLYGDPTRLYQAFQKLLLNALKYTPDGGRVTVSSRLIRSKEITEQIAGYIDVMVKDTGIGINKEDLESIFEKFVTASDVSLHSSGKTKFKGGGPGLGLPIARGIIEAHGGRIWAESLGVDEENYPGSTFHVELPLRIKPPELD